MTEDLFEWQQQLDTAVKLGKMVDAPGLFGRLLARWRGTSTAERDWQSEALEALRENAIDTLRNIPLTITDAVRSLGPEFNWDDLKEPDPTWTNHWLTAVSKVAPDDHERRSWWSRLLAGEIRQPGSYSLRTLAVMDVLSTEEARLFSRLSSYVWTFNPDLHTLITPIVGSSLWIPNTVEWSMLEAAGLVTHSATGLNINLSKGDRFTIMLGTTQVVLDAQNDAILPMGDYLLTEAGQEIWRLTEPRVDPVYLARLLAEWKKHSNAVVVNQQ